MQHLPRLCHHPTTHNCSGWDHHNKHWRASFYSAIIFTMGEQEQGSGEGQTHILVKARIELAELQRSRFCSAPFVGHIQTNSLKPTTVDAKVLKVRSSMMSRCMPTAAMPHLPLHNTKSQRMAVLWCSKPGKPGHCVPQVWLRCLPGSSK